jgi:endoglucanase
VRLAVAPDMVLGDAACPELVAAAIRRLQARGLAVVVGPHPSGWRLETQAADRAALLAFWRRLAPFLRPLDPALIVPEVLNEPVFAGQPAAWASLQRATLAAIRATLTQPRVLLTGADWGSIGGLLALQPLDDARALYSAHFYDPVELTSLAAYRPGLDRAALARLPFPMTGAACAPALQTPDRPTADLIRFVCAMHWDAAAVDARIGAAASWAARHRVPVLLGEFGATAALDRPARLAWIGAVRRSCASHGIGWALWGYDDIMGFAQHPPAPAGATVLDAGLLAALGLRAG